ncbi:hypothetical protein CcaverHIS002_0704680 [Cutaneotrichosporon cavernicola]|uniref:J domain-containing protein n=1 Tax=Cutaneotrichosporon cavernicola TaxID=279322 RepID=A0AA48LAG3_9TREE|nr:uncharacterized protein CcaverHIS019_0704760 [Cutaneotrichosporon cavernicola]BEI87122.1 hypothetical protein CcaverHIS002_0704680 [Cutaneotrichosporon cavernicola]BEI94895.1 hypothetical protein CcaverHIS019_0704760 [Cutaneotrichosporon cavernicola]BEJ02669.1 hypothetical protein CcaverHIS631_0704640 [Cutaneotrichosporon cavernicola]BEJ10425.1 hypothetical protein CcaverHIS641_0704600 [Cutaneotrichosporon cavernicola]
MSKTTDATRTAEVERILRAFKKNPYEALDIDAFATDAEVKKAYRKKSLLIHPDKFQHEQGPEAFDLLKKAEGMLSDAAEREKIDSILTYARTLVLKEALGSGYSTKVADDDPRVTGMSPPFQIQLRTKAKQLILEESMDEKNRANMVAVNEANERAAVEAEKARRKRKVEEQKAWDERRDERIGDWRNYMHKEKVRKVKKAKKNLHVLG